MSLPACFAQRVGHRVKIELALREEVDKRRDRSAAGGLRKDLIPVGRAHVFGRFVDLFDNGRQALEVALGILDRNTKLGKHRLLRAGEGPQIGDDHLELVTRLTALDTRVGHRG